MSGDLTSSHDAGNPLATGRVRRLGRRRVRWQPADTSDGPAGYGLDEPNAHSTAEVGRDAWLNAQRPPHWE